MRIGDLRQTFDPADPPAYLFFWGHTEKPGQGPTRACLSLWYPSPFEVDGRRYATAEHFMMAGKAALFGDQEARRKILEAPDPAAAKKLGRGVRGFDQEMWEANREAIVLAGSVAKFSQDEALGGFLRATGDKVLVEASPRDRIWGIGLGASNPAASDPHRWRGVNLLGFVLMDAREQLA